MKKTLVRVVFILLLAALNSGCSDKRKKYIVVSSEDNGTPILSATPTSLNLGETKDYDYFTISNIGSGTLNWQVVNDLPTWLTVDPMSGSCPDYSVVWAEVSRDNLQPGTYSHIINISSNGGSATVAVTMIVHSPGTETPILDVQPDELNFSNDYDYDYLFVGNIGSGILNWQITSDLSAWLCVDPMSGSLGADYWDWVYVSVNIDRLTPGTYTHTLTVTSNGGNATVKVTLVVTPPAVDVKIKFTPTRTLQAGYPIVYSDVSGTWSGSIMTDSDADGTYEFTYPEVQYACQRILNLEASPGEWAAISSATAPVVKEIMANGVPLEMFKDNGLGGSNFRLELDDEGDVLCLNRTTDPLRYKQWYHHHINVLNAWSTTMGSNDIVVAVIDDGVATTHSDLAANIWTNTDEIPGNGIDDDGNGYIDDVQGWDYYDEDNDPNPVYAGWEPYQVYYSHGTAVAGIIAARQNAIGISGVAPNVKIMPIRIFGEWGATIAGIDSAIRYAADNGAHVINMSFGTDYDIPQIRYAIEYAYNKGVVLVASAGNWGDDWSQFPAAYPQVIGVSALDRDDHKTWWSSYGEYNSDLCAPGVDMYSTMWPAGPFTAEYSKKFLNGTSFSAPQVAGAAALILSVRPGLHPDDVRQIFITTGDNLDSQHPELQPYDLGPRLNVKAALDATPGFVPTSFFAARLAAVPPSRVQGPPPPDGGFRLN